MKTAVLITLFVVFGIALAEYTEHHNGQPGCKTDQEMTQRLWRNNFDPTKYFVCETKDKPAEYASCQQEFLFDATKLACVPHTEWVWTEPIDPPSMA